MDPARPRYRFPRSARIRTRAEFDRVFAARRRASDALLTLYSLENSVDEVRLGIAVGRRFGKAVQRNRIKRLIREAFRHLRPELPRGTDWVVVPRPGVTPTYTQVRQSLERLASRLIRRQTARLETRSRE